MKKIFVFGMLCFLFFFDKVFPISNIENLNKINNYNVHFFEQNPWFFIKLKLVEKPNKSANSLMQKIASGGLGISTAFILSSCVKLLTDSSIAIIFTASSVPFITDYFYKNFIRDYFYFKALIKFLDHYNSTSYGYRQLTPKELIEILDKLYAKYKKQGKESIRIEGLNFIKELSALDLNSNEALIFEEIKN